MNRRGFLWACIVGPNALMGALAPALADAEPPPLPSVLAAQFPQLKVRGNGLLTWYGIRIYRATLWTQGGELDLNAPYVLQLQYLRSLEGEALATRSIEEMKGQGVGNDALYALWLAQMRKAFPNVKANDRIAGLHLPGTGARFYFNGSLTHEIKDAAFAKAFFDIWLGPKTSQPGLRKQLLGTQ